MILVLGPESAGNHLAGGILKALGCRGSLTDPHPYARAIPRARAGGPPLWWSKSIPSNLEWPDIEGMVGRARKAEYEVEAIVPLRGWFPMTRSQVGLGRVETIAEAEHNIREAVEYVARELRRAEVEWITLIYEELLARPTEVVTWLADRLGIGGNAQHIDRAALSVRDENSKHWIQR